MILLIFELGNSLRGAPQRKTQPTLIYHSCAVEQGGATAGRGARASASPVADSRRFSPFLQTRKQRKTGAFKIALSVFVRTDFYCRSLIRLFLAHFP